MRLLLAVCCLALALADVYSDDSADIDGMLSRADGYMKDDSKYTALFNCLVDRGPCNDNQQKTKDVMKKIDATDCGMCSAKQRSGLIDARDKLWGKHPQYRDEYVKYYNLPPQAFFTRQGN